MKILIKFIIIYFLIHRNTIHNVRYSDNDPSVKNLKPTLTECIVSRFVGYECVFELPAPVLIRPYVWVCLRIYMLRFIQYEAIIMFTLCSRLMAATLEYTRMTNHANLRFTLSDLYYNNVRICYWLPRLILKASTSLMNEYIIEFAYYNYNVPQLN